MTTYYVLRIGGVLSRVVPLAALYALAALAARLAYLLPTPARTAARGNIGRAMGQPPKSKAVRRAAAQAFRCQALNYVDLMRVDRITRAELDASVVRGDLTPLIETVARGNGAIIVSGHVGNMDYVAQWMGLHGYQVYSVMERLRPERLFTLVRRQREAAGIHMEPLESAALGVLTRALRAGAVVALLADRDIGGAGEPVEFFGAPARLPSGPALLALRTGAPLLAAFGRRLPDNRLYVSIQPPVYLHRTRDLRADLRAGLRVMARLLEEGIATSPEQWIVFAPIWQGGAA